MQFRRIHTKERRLIGKPPVSKTGTAGSIPAAPGLNNNVAGIEESRIDATFRSVLICGEWPPRFPLNEKGDFLRIGTALTSNFSYRLLNNESQVPTRSEQSERRAPIPAAPGFLAVQTAL